MPAPDANKAPVMTTSLFTKQQAQPRYTAPELDDAIVASSLIEADFVNIEPVSPEVAFRWIEFKAQDGLRFAQAQAQGWVVATKTDVKGQNLSPYVKDGGTKFINGDLILMKMDRKKYLGAKKTKHLKAEMMRNPQLLMKEAARRAEADLTQAGASKDERSKVSTFVPSQSDIAKAVSKLGTHTGPPDMGK